MDILSGQTSKADATVQNMAIDPVALWNLLPEDAKERLGAAAIVHVLVEEFCAGGYPAAVADNALVAAGYESFGVMVSVVNSHVVENEKCDPVSSDWRPDLNKIGVRSCTACGCTDEYGCPEGCFWVKDTLCSTCGAKPSLTCDAV